MKYYIAPLALVLSSVLTTTVQAETQLFISTSINQDAQIQLNYPAAVRIEQIVQDGLVQLPKYNKTNQNEVVPIYWLGAALLDIENTAVLETKRQQVLTLLSKMGEAKDDSAYIAKLAKLAQFIRNLKLGQRVIQPLDVDVIRINDSYNALINGRFLLVLPPRPTTVTVLGAVAQTGSFTWQNQLSSKDYLKQAGILNNAETSFIWIIQPDGQAIKQPIAYWNHQTQDIAPGATLYVEFSSGFGDDTSLNENMIELLRNRAL
ncbi:capsule biosynthesis GfcC family protein [Shewanella sp. NKUCC06_TVS]|uniref:capsule biosynthesis GfcC family protein n=1 Tax=Shewanella sp. NKUCC06_TVS TaxID=2842128 RepID=UPI001C5BB5C9|nr:capsule biosynthesis GfcC family protein [Shewanella sp. NKUCC06_TVS]MBW3530932.1 capsule biosynthesis GfcC family protein [Shewanella sp. NKUCC06_TVS]